MNYADRIKESTTATSTSTVTLSGAQAGFRSFASALAAGATLIPVCVADAAGNWEIGTYTLTDAATLTRTAILSSSNGGAAVTFPAGSKDVFVTVPAAMLSKLASATDTATSTIADPATSTLLIEEGGVTKRIKVSDFLISMGQAAVDLNAAGTLAGSDVFTCVQDGANEVKTTLSAIAAAVAAINGTPDTTAPTFSSAKVANATPTVIDITMSEALANVVPATSAFAVSGGKTVSGVAVAGTKVSVTVNAAYAYGDTITVTYTKPGASALQDAAGNQTAGFGPSSVTNNIAAPAATAPGAPTIGTATAGDASASVTFTAPASNGGSAITGYTVTAYKASDNTAVATATGTSSPINVTGLTNGVAVYFKAAATNSVGTGAQSAASNTVTPAAAAASYTIAGYSGNAVKATQSAANALGTSSVQKSFSAGSTVNGQFTVNGYWSISPTPPTDGTALAYAGWSNSNSTPPAIITQAQNTGGDASINGMTPMTHPGAYLSQANLWVPVGSGTTTWYYWIKPSDGPAQCVNPSGMVVSGM